MQALSNYNIVSKYKAGPFRFHDSKNILIHATAVFSLFPASVLISLKLDLLMVSHLLLMLNVVLFRWVLIPSDLSAGFTKLKLFGIKLCVNFEIVCLALNVVLCFACMAVGMWKEPSGFTQCLEGWSDSCVVYMPWVLSRFFCMVLLTHTSVLFCTLILRGPTQNVIPVPPAEGELYDRQPDQIDEIASENEEACSICLVNKRKIALFPCGHYKFCIDCAKSLNDRCPVCRQIVQSKGRIY